MRKHLNKDGFVVVRHLIEPSLLESIVSDFFSIFAEQARQYSISVSGDANFENFAALAKALFRSDLAAYLAAAKLCQYTVSLHNLSVSDLLIGVLAQLNINFPTIATRPVVHFVGDDIQIPGGYYKTPPHQDWRSIQGSLDSVVSWIPFCNISANSHPLEVIPGSHRSGLLPSENDAFGHRVAGGHFTEKDFVPLELEAGDAIFFSTFLVHRTGENGGVSFRAATSFRYNNAAEPTFVSRQYPNPYVYHPDLRIIHPGFPTARDVEEIFSTDNSTKIQTSTENEFRDP